MAVMLISREHSVAFDDILSCNNMSQKFYPTGTRVEMSFRRVVETRAERSEAWTDVRFTVRCPPFVVVVATRQIFFQ